MTKATARIEFAPIIEKAGFVLRFTHQSQPGPPYCVPHLLMEVYFHAERNEGFKVYYSVDAFVDASWHAPTEYITVVDKRRDGQRGAVEQGSPHGTALVADAKRRAIGMSSVRAQMRTCTDGMEIGYQDLKRRIRNKDWRTS